MIRVVTNSASVCVKVQGNWRVCVIKTSVYKYQLSETMGIWLENDMMKLFRKVWGIWKMSYARNL